MNRLTEESNQIMNNRAIWTMLIINFMGMFSYSIVLPLLPYYATTFGASPLEVGFIFSIYSLFQFFSAPIMGKLSDSQGRKKWLLLSLLGTSIGFAFMAMASSIIWLLLGRLIDGISGGNLTIAQAYIGDNSTEGERTRIYSYLTTTQGLGAIVGPGMAAYLVANYSYQTAMWAAMGVAFGAALVILFLLPDSSNIATNRKVLSVSDNLRRVFSGFNVSRIEIGSELKSLYLIGGICGLVFAGFFPTLTQYMQLQLNFSVQQTGFVFTFFGFVLLVYQPAFSRILVVKLRDPNLMILGVGFLLVASILVGVAWNYVSILACVVFYGISLNTIRSPLASLIALEAGNNQKGIALGFLQSINSLSQIVAPITIGWLMSYVSYSAPGIVGGSVILMLLFWVKLSRYTKVRTKSVS